MRRPARVTWLAGLVLAPVLAAAVDQGVDLDAAARAFAARPQLEDLVSDNQPLLEQAYPLIVEDYHRRAGPYQPLPAPDRRRVESCAAHYADVWLGRRLWWPTDAQGAPDWETIYVHALDHYLGHCLRQPLRLSPQDD